MPVVKCYTQNWRVLDDVLTVTPRVRSILVIARRRLEKKRKENILEKRRRHLPTFKRATTLCSMAALFSCASLTSSSPPFEEKSGGRRMGGGYIRRCPSSKHTITRTHARERIRPHTTLCGRRTYYCSLSLNRIEGGKKEDERGKERGFREGVEQEKRTHWCTLPRQRILPLLDFFRLKILIALWGR